MKFNEWIAQEVRSYDGEITEIKKANEKLQQELKTAQHDKREIGKKDNRNNKLHDQADEYISSIKSRIESHKSKISVRKSKITEYKSLNKMKPVRLKTGAVVNSKIVDEMLKKLTGKYWSIEYTQYQDGLQIAYINTRTGSKGSFKVYLMAVISDTVELPLFEKGEVKECSIHS
ncbi:hypothetical protein FH508_0008535 [Lysinibacillus sp. CD3-6]|uniref:hypothetical protein n=1 Tax=Lysinibacillus sp. CD3-6 TaxID=2892541 RepID=UPI00111F3D5D|nr:hypothetical protein [Lysinibacillus sp. CD3-6]UED81927.1 hypothetical protein FH508_0008535 [Lysinibacillus sp. CD3-6]